MAVQHVRPGRRNPFRRAVILDLWDRLCVVCGRSFLDERSVTIEHLVPRSLGGGGYGNVAPSHYTCNSIRKTKSLIQAAQMVERQFDHIVLRCGIDRAVAWLNKPHPNKQDDPPVPVEP